MSTSIHSPEERLWWNTPVEKTEVLWVTIALIWCLFMFFMMTYWHIAGSQNISNEAYYTSTDAYEAKVEAFADKYKVREEEGVPVVHAPAGSDVYLLGKTWEWWPILELEKGQSYRFHISSIDRMHGFSLLPENINLQVINNYEMVLTVTPTSSGEFGVICNEFCGIGHHSMVSKIYVVDK